ncbi:MAG: Ig-like domain-containing protein, partial [Desulfuromonadales bacterium]
IGIGKASGSLDFNGQLYDVGTVVLDAQPIAVREVDPAPGTVNAPVVSTVHILFSEPARLDTVNSTTIKLLKGTTQVPGSLQLDADGTGVTFTPASPLQGFALYTVVVSTNLRDRVGRPLVQTWSSTFTTVDNVPPTVTAVSPANAAIQVAPDAVVRLTFSEAIDSAALDGIRMLKGGEAVEARLDQLQGGTVVALTPLSPLATNDVYTVSVSGVRDTVGNVQIGTFTASFNTLDTIPPTVSSMSVPSEARLIKGLSATVTAAVADSDVALVDFFADDVLVATDKTAPYSFSLPLARAGTLQLKAIALDMVGNRGAATLLSLEVAPDQPPTAAILQPPEGTLVGTGGQFTVRVQGSDDIGVKEVTLTATGAMSFSQTKALSGTPATAYFTLSVPAAALPGSAIVLAATVKDSGGQTSATVQRSVTVQDSVAPTLTLSSPGQTVPYKPGEAGVATVSASDNIAVTGLTCTASGAATGSGNFIFDPAAKQQTQQFTFSIFDNAAPHAQATITCSARDAAGNSGQNAITLQVADVVPPQVQTTSITDGATDVPIGSTFSVTFDEPLAAATVNSSTVVLSAAGGTQALAGAVSLLADGRTVIFAPAAPLERSTQYQLSLATALTDEAGNPLEAAYLLHFTADDTPPEIKSISPAADSQNAPVGSAVAVTF